MTKKQLIHQKSATFGKKRLLTKCLHVSRIVIRSSRLSASVFHLWEVLKDSLNRMCTFLVIPNFNFTSVEVKKEKKNPTCYFFLLRRANGLTSRTAKEIQASTRSTQLAFFMKKELRSCLTARKCQSASMFARVCIIESCLKWLLFVEQLMIQQGRLNKTTGNQGNVRFLHLDSTSTGYGDGQQSSTAT